MIIYKCRFSGDEMLTDAFKPGPVTNTEGNVVPGLIQIQSQKVPKASTVLDESPHGSYVVKSYSVVQLI
jgi:hypothetical protein